MDILDKVIPKIGERIARYELTAELGRGGFGVVYKARQVGLEADVAIKLLIPQMSEQANQMQILERFEQEARVIKQLEHPAALKVRDFGRWQGLPYLVTEFVRGETLADVLRNQGPLPPHRIARIARQVLSCLAEAHYRKIVHRDLKPANIMIRDIFGEEDAVKVLDFGIAKVSSEEGVVTMTGLRFGTPQYMSPEQCRGLRDLDGRVDIYGLGLIMAECVTGFRIVDLDTMGAFYAQASFDPVAFPPPVRQSPLWPVIDGATQKDRDQRFPDALTMRKALDGVAASPSSSFDRWPAQPSPAPPPHSSPAPSGPTRSPHTPSPTPGWSQPQAPASQAPAPSSAPGPAPVGAPAAQADAWNPGATSKLKAQSGPVSTPSPSKPSGSGLPPPDWLPESAPWPGSRFPPADGPAPKAVVSVPGVGPGGPGQSAPHAHSTVKRRAAPAEEDGQSEAPSSKRGLILLLAVVVVVGLAGFLAVQLLGSDEGDADETAGGGSGAAGRISVTANISDFDVFVDGEQVVFGSLSPDVAFRAPIGDRTVDVRRDGWTARTASVRVERDETEELQVELLPRELTVGEVELSYVQPPSTSGGQSFFIARRPVRIETLLGSCYANQRCRDTLSRDRPEDRGCHLAIGPNAELPVNCLTHATAQSLCESLGLRLPTLAEARWSVDDVTIRGDVWQWTSDRDELQDGAHAVFGGPSTVSAGLVGLSSDGFEAMLRDGATASYAGVRCALDADAAVEIAIDSEGPN